MQATFILLISPSRLRGRTGACALWRRLIHLYPFRHRCSPVISLDSEKMSDPSAKPAGNLDLWDKVFGFCSAILGIIPPALTGFGVHGPSLYNPPIYEHLEPFLIIPGMVALYASWSIMTSNRSVHVIFAIALVLALVVLFVYLDFPEQKTVFSINIHAPNWILSYCVLAMAIALLFGFLLALKRYRT